MRSTLIEKQTVFTGQRCKVEVHRLEDPETGRKYTREVVVHPGAVVILAINSRNEVVLIKNKRYAIDQLLLELPAGTIEGSEPPMNCAGRELLEETGYLAGKLEPLASFFSSPGLLTEKLHAFVATNLEKRAQKLDEGEEIEVTEVPLNEAIYAAQIGEIIDAKSIATLLMYAARQSQK